MREEIKKSVEKLLGEAKYLEYSPESECYIYTIVNHDYEIGPHFLKDLFNTKGSRIDYVIETILPYELNEISALIANLFNECKELPGVTDEDENDILEYLTDHVVCHVTEDYMWAEKIDSQIILQVEDEANHEFTLNSVEDGKLLDGSVKWLIEQQGYTVEEFMSVWNGEETELSDNKFLRSVAFELDEVTTDTNKLTILTKMNLRSIVEWNEYLECSPNSNEMMIIPKGVRIGLIDTCNGAGSHVAIELEKDLVIPMKNIYAIKPDVCFNYSVGEIYGVSSSFWSNIDIPLPEKLKEELF